MLLSLARSGALLSKGSILQAFYSWQATVRVLTDGDQFNSSSGPRESHKWVCGSVVQLSSPSPSHLILHCHPCNLSAQAGFYHRLKSLSKQALLFSCQEKGQS